MFKRISAAFSSLYTTFSSTLSSLFSMGKIDAESLQKLEKLLLQADTGVSTTQKIVEQLKQNPGDNPHQALAQILKKLLIPYDVDQQGSIIILVGINGAGKTTSAAKLAYLFKAHRKAVHLAAADTFRAAAVDQLTLWATRLQIPIITGLPQQDPSAVIYQACQAVKNSPQDILIIDTAGRLQTKTHLMKELEKIHRTITKQLPHAKVTTLLVLDGMLGQNSLEQAKIFNQSTKVDGIILTKTDGTGKGGIVFAIADQLQIPIAYVTFGEDIADIALFDKDVFVDKLLS